MQERRQFVRLDASVEVEHQVVKEPAAQISKSRNIGGGGIRLIIFERLQPNSEIKLKIKLPDNQPPINITGRVAWQEPFSISTEGEREHYDTGVEFTQINPADRARIEKFVFKYLKD